MSGLFGGGGAATQQVEQQKQQVAKQEQRELVEKTDLARKTMASVKARRGGGMRFLLTGLDDDQSGKSTLGG